MIKNIPRIQEESNFEVMRSYAPGERELIAKIFERAWSKSKIA